MRMTFVLVLAGLAMAAVPATAQTQKIGYVDSRRLFQQAPGAQEARTLIQGEMARFQSQVKILEDSANALVQDFQRKSVLLSPDEKARQEQALLQKHQSLSERAREIEAQAGARQEELMKPVTDKIQQAIEAAREAGGFAIILDAAAGAMVAADSTLDLTDQVLERMRSSADSGASSSSNGTRNQRNPPKES